MKNEQQLLTDPRAALAEILPEDWPEHRVEAAARFLAERGVLLVDIERLAALLYPYMTKEQAAAIFAALSGETDPGP